MSRDLITKLRSYDWTMRAADDDWRETPSLTEQAAAKIERMEALLTGVEIALARDEDIDGAMKLIVAERAYQQQPPEPK